MKRMTKEQLEAEVRRVIDEESLSDEEIRRLLAEAHINGMTEVVNVIRQKYPESAERFFASLTTFASTAIPAQQHEVETDPAEDGEISIYIAAQYGKTEVVELLLDRNANINQQDNNGKTALHAAAECGEIGVVKLLLDRGANINQQDNNGKTALHAAAQYDEIGVVKLLLDKGANINQPDNNGKTALCLAVENADAKMAKLLLTPEAGSELISGDTNTLLDYALTQVYRYYLLKLYDPKASEKIQILELLLSQSPPEMDLSKINLLDPFKKALKIYQKIYPQDHSMNDLIDFYNVEEAIEETNNDLIKMGLKIYQRVSRENNSLTFHNLEGIITDLLNSHSISPAASIGSSYGRDPDENKESETENAQAGAGAAPAAKWRAPAVTLAPSAQKDIEAIGAPAAEPQGQEIG
jgi:hypothetical protein